MMKMNVLSSNNKISELNITFLVILKNVLMVIFKTYYRKTTNNARFKKKP
jgi:hypothetical protein